MSEKQDIGKHFGLLASNTQSPELSEKFLKINLSFLRRLPTRQQELEGAYRQKDWGQLQFHAHRLAGAGLFGFESLGASASELELALEAKSYDKVTQLFEKILKLSEQALTQRAELEQLLASKYP